MADGEIPVVLKPQGFKETTQQANEASKSLELLGHFQGELTRRFGLGVASFKLMEQALEGIEEHALAAEHRLNELGKVAREAGEKTQAAFEGRDTNLAGNAAGKFAVLRQSGARGGGTADALAVAKKYGASLDDALAAIATGADLETANKIRAFTGGSLTEAAGALAKLPGGKGSNVAAAVVNQLLGPANPKALLRGGADLDARLAVADADPTVKAAKAAVANQARLDAEKLGLAPANGDKVGTAKAISDLQNPGVLEQARATAKAESARVDAENALAERERTLGSYGLKGTLFGGAPSLLNPAIDFTFGSGTRSQREAVANTSTEAEKQGEILRVMIQSGIKTRPVHGPAADQ